MRNGRKKKRGGERESRVRWDHPSQLFPNWRRRSQSEKEVFLGVILRRSKGKGGGFSPGREDTLAQTTTMRICAGVPSTLREGRSSLGFLGVCPAKRYVVGAQRSTGNVQGKKGECCTVGRDLIRLSGRENIPVPCGKTGGRE